jgi:ABC transporter with metal-binding/Fe-S-binding domain ATP-binding protein
LSGGKDSVLAGHVVRDWGWDIVCAIRVLPAADDSWMFHVPNLRVIPFQAGAWGIPLRDVAVSGEAEREVEDLRVGLEGLPADALVSGALASEYQKTRIDRVGHVLGLKTFAPLWHKEPTEVLSSLISQGFDVRFSATAADGFDENWLGRRLDGAALRDLARLHVERGIHIGGEGGEYETVVLDAPGWNRAVVPTAAANSWHRDRGTWAIEACHLGPIKRPAASPASRPS